MRFRSLLSEEIKAQWRELHERTLRELAAPCNCENPLLVDGWLPWARCHEYIAPRQYIVDDTPGASEAKQFREYWTRRRDDNVDKFSWAVPCHTALDMIVKYSSILGDGSPRILEIGSGLGYWASLLQAYGADIIAVDTGEESRGEPMFPHFPATVLGCGIEYLKSHDGCPDRALFLCWPRHGDAILDAYKGSIVIWIGEDNHGCTWYLGDDHEGEWKKQDSFQIPTWPDVWDYMAIYTRR